MSTEFQLPLEGITRRQLLRLGASSALLCSLGGLAPLARGADTGGYKALVCLYLAGGNNGFNWIVPRTQAAYDVYAASRGNLAISREALHELPGAASDGNAYGFHPDCPELKTLFQGGQLAILCNVGTLVQPTTKAEVVNGTVPVPLQLFSHIDQQTAWMTSLPDQLSRTGWAGRMADLLAQQSGNAKLATNISIGGTNYWQEGQEAMPYTLGTGGAPTLDVLHNTSYRGGRRAAAAQALIDQGAADGHRMVAEFARIFQQAEAKVKLVNDAMSAVGPIATKFPVYEGDDGLGEQLRTVAQCIKAHDGIRDSRQIFYVQIGGFDTHNNELAQQGKQLNTVSENLQAFWQALVEIGMTGSVTLFTASDFGRSLGSNGDGSDHAWGNHHIILGGAVQGGRYYGTMPSLRIGGADDIGAGRILPTTSTDQYAATLAKWFGIAADELPGLFPYLERFSPTTLGFMADA